ncbi:hypothetical protein FSC37_06845 [Piscinibacter aquaticus]|uniref:Uncharacterized protein n=1 Tax=Piscinibacter aquaticus TaxID=392597 RepID=A0A5C6TYZ8_9BURK|nr:hypothetical protein FSC37_06845 [Piscinibacter aquaticus]
MSDQPTRAMIESRTDFQNAVRGALAEAALVGCREIWLVDDDYADWPLGERAVVDDLTHWASMHRSFTVVARSFDHLARHQARWVTRRRQFSHRGALPHQQRSRSRADAQHPADSGADVGPAARPCALSWRGLTGDVGCRAVARTD